MVEFKAGVTGDKGVWGGVALKQKGRRRGRWVDIVDYPDKDSKVSLSQLYTIHGLRIRETI
jgi:hypothetical protein